VWTIIPTLLVTAIGVYSAVVLGRNDALGANVLRVNVTAQQFAWSFNYPEAKGLTSGTLRLPKDRSVELVFNAKDVIHSFWVPEFSQKQDTVPGIVTRLHITPNRLGTFPVICTELCGLGHAVMRTTAVVMSPAAFDKWLHGQTKAVSSPNASVSGSAVFKNNQCGSCHSLKAAGATGKIGPDLDQLASFAKTAGKPVDAFTRESIVDPSAYVQKGFPDNVMPHTYGSALSKQELDSLVQYLVSSSKKG
jgi:cytochrome c oxidase subunit 2